ncbi:Sucrose transport protein SUC5 [Glycine soja]|nr:Sucrose transport protein SUC5 [Glycine soja]
MMGPTGACGAWGSYSVHVDPSAGDVSELDCVGEGVFMLNSLVLAATSLGVEVLARGVGGVKRLWGIVNFLLALCLAITVLVTKLAQHTLLPNSHQEPLPPPAAVKAAALALFSVLGIPLAITYSIPFALASIFSSTSGAGQGLSLGVLNLAIVIPQMVVSVISGP